MLITCSCKDFIPAAELFFSELETLDACESYFFPRPIFTSKGTCFVSRVDSAAPFAGPMMANVVTTVVDPTRSPSTSREIDIWFTYHIVHGEI